jgi:hypothetical protein
MTEIRARYDPTTRIVDGYFPNNLNYPNNIIDDENCTIDGKPFVLITNKEHQDNSDKKMCVIDQIFQEYIPPLNEQLTSVKATKIAEIEAKYIAELSKPILGGSKDGVPYYFDREKIKTKMVMIPVLTSASMVPVETVEGEIIKLSKDEFILICSSLNEFENNEIIQRSTRRSAIEALQTIEEVINYEISITEH